jgi:hypothetical protein
VNRKRATAFRVLSFRSHTELRLPKNCGDQRTHVDSRRGAVAGNFVHNRRGCGYERERDSKDIETERKKLRSKKNCLRLKSETEYTREIILTLDIISEGIKNYDNNYNFLINDPLLHSFYF